MDNNKKKYKICLAGNPNVGKSTVFNNLTGLKQHTGNWAGKTVELAKGKCDYKNNTYEIMDLPGTYSLISHSAEEEVAKDYICGGESECIVVVCDATALERNLFLVLQVLEITSNVVLCVNLIDEMERKNICLDFLKLEKMLGIPVVAISARRKKDPVKILDKVNQVIKNGNKAAIFPEYTKDIEQIIKESGKLRHEAVSEIAKESEKLADKITSCIVLTAEGISAECVKEKCSLCKDRKIDRFLTSKRTGIPIMILFLMVILWITISGANYPSSLLSKGFDFLEGQLASFMSLLKSPEWLSALVCEGMFRVLGWVISVMLPPMAIFFPLFTLLEDLGYLPRIAFNLDKLFKKAGACGKQSLTMCMSLGCNACGIVGARIIDSPRERLIAILTNNFIPCNGRFPTLISILTIFFVVGAGGLFSTVSSAALLTLVIVFSVVVTFAVSSILSKTLLKGVPSSFTLELPPYRKPQFGKVLWRSLVDRTLFVLGRAVIVAAPAGIVIWILANVYTGDSSLLSVCANFLDPFGKALGLDGVIIFAFILGFPANEIVIPIIIMTYMANGSLIEFSDNMQLFNLLSANGWTWITAVSMLLFTIMHFPCSTTLLTTFKETKSVKWTFLSFAIPTVSGIIICFIFNTIVTFFC